MTQTVLPPTTSAPARGISGRVFVFAFLPLIVIGGLAMFSVAVRFQSIMKHLELVRAAWPNVAVDLKHRYERFEDSIESNPPNGFPRREWDQLKKEFEATNQFDRQSQVVPQLESIIANATGDRHWESKDFANARFENLRSAEQTRQQVQNDWLGRLTIYALRLRLPPRLEIVDD